jgi:hypothetical protein
MIKAASASETSKNFYHTARRGIPEDMFNIMNAGINGCTEAEKYNENEKEGTKR